METNSREKEINLQPSHIKVYMFVKKYINDKIYSPELQEISGGTSISMRHVYRIVDDLVHLGYMSKNMYEKRSLKIVKEIK